MNETSVPPLADASPRPVPGERWRAWRNPWLFVALIALAVLLPVLQMNKGIVP